MSPRGVVVLHVTLLDSLGGPGAVQADPHHRVPRASNFTRTGLTLLMEAQG